MKRPFWQSWQFIVGVALIIGVTTGVMHNINEANKDKTNITKTVEVTQNTKIKEVKDWKPKEIAEFNSLYISNNDKNPDGSKLVINVFSIERKDGNIVIVSKAPQYEFLKYSADKFMAINCIDAEGNTITIKSIIVSQVDADSTEIIVTGDNLDKAKWIEIMPYQTQNKNWITFEVK